MMTLRIQAASSWEPGPEAASPDVSAIPSLLRRRMSRLTRMAVHVALEACRQASVDLSSVPVVMASRHGEMDVTLKLLEQMAMQEPLSPMDFSGSVHHTAIGYLSIVAQNRNIMRAVAGGRESFCYGFLDACGLLAENPKSPVLLLAADDRVASPFDGEEGAAFPYAVAFLLASTGSDSKETLTFDLGPAPAPKPPSPEKEEIALRFLKWLRTEKAPLQWTSGSKQWRWQK